VSDDDLVWCTIERLFTFRGTGVTFLAFTFTSLNESVASIH
jgi:hypothetical protein